MKSIKKLTLLALVIFMASCSREPIDAIEETQNEEFNQASQRIHTPSNIPDNENVFVAIVDKEACQNTLRLYTIYAAASEIKPYDREVQAAVLKNGTFIEAKLLTIPAYQLNSSNVPAFVGAPDNYGNVISRAYNVSVDGVIQSDYNFPTIAYNISNCYYNSSNSNCYEGVYPADDPDTVANEGAGDQDNDGECNSTDMDDNGNNIPDTWE